MNNRLVASSPFWRACLSAAAAASVLVVSGCTTFSKDGGFDSVVKVARERLGKEAKPIRSAADADAVRDAVDVLLAKPLSVDDAVQIAVLNNRGLQATYGELGIAEADLVQAGRLQNPGFNFRRTREGDDVLIERTFTVNLIRLLTLPLAARIEGRRFEQVKLEVADAVLRVATDTRRAWFEAVAAEQGVAYAKQVGLAAEAGSDLARRMRAAGNFSKLDQAREEAFQADAVAGIARAAGSAVRSREKLTRLMGLVGEQTRFTLPDRLPELPSTPLAIDNAESYAIENRLDIQAGKLQGASLASSLGLSRATRFINVLELSRDNNSRHGPPERGYEIRIDIPIFDWGTARVARAEAIYMQAMNRFAETAVNARSEVRQSYLGYRTAYDLARHYRDNVVPLRKRISDENQLRYNGMLISVFELLADAREQVRSVSGYIDALRDFWIAETDLSAALGGKLPDEANPDTNMTPATPMRPPEKGN